MQNSSQFTDSKSKKSKGLLFTLTFTLGLLVALIFAANTAHAGLISFVAELIGSEPASAKTKAVPLTPSTQKLAILQAAVNTDPNPDKPLETMPVENGETLNADLVSPDGSGGLPVNTQVSTYIVRPGDNASSIAKMFGVTVNTILWANNLTRATSLQVGQSLLILPVTGITYTVKKGDTVKSVVSKFKADLQEVLSYNELTANSTLTVGQTIIIPDVELQVSVPTKIVFKDNPAHDTNGPEYRGYYSRPTRGSTITQGLHGYNGIDLADRKGTPIYAAAAGKVIVSIQNGAWNGGYGNVIIISHDNGTQTVYAHNSKNLVHVGDIVTARQQIALMGATGHATGPHVHFEVRGAKNPCAEIALGQCQPW